jgi:hypothetical protein
MVGLQDHRNLAPLDLLTGKPKGDGQINVFDGVSILRYVGAGWVGRRSAGEVRLVGRVTFREPTTRSRTQWVRLVST